MKIYVASSWRNPYQPVVVSVLRSCGHEVYDFRNPDVNDHGFHWSEIDLEWQQWRRDEYLEALQHPIAESGFSKDFDAMKSCDAFVLVCPSGRSAHLEFGWAIGAGKSTVIYLPEPQEPELMYKLADLICITMEQMRGIFGVHTDV